MTWLEWAKKFFSDPGTVVTMLTSGVVGLVIGIANGVVQKRHGGWPSFFGAIATGVVIAVIVGLATFDYVKSETVRYAIIGFCTVISDDIWAGMKTFGASFRTNPLESFFRVLDALRGRAQTPPAAPTPNVAPTPKEE